MAALRSAAKDQYWKDKLTLTILFRRKNPRGEDVDYIEDLASRGTKALPRQRSAAEQALRESAKQRQRKNELEEVKMRFDSEFYTELYGQGVGLI